MTTRNYAPVSGMPHYPYIHGADVGQGGDLHSSIPLRPTPGALQALQFPHIIYSLLLVSFLGEKDRVNAWLAQTLVGTARLYVDVCE